MPVGCGSGWKLKHAGDIQPRVHLSYPTSPDVCEYPGEKSRICYSNYAGTSPEDVTPIAVSA